MSSHRALRRSQEFSVASHVPGYAHWRDPARERRGFLSRAGATLLSLLTIPMAGAQGKIYRIGYLNPRASKDAVDDAFLRGMEEHGYTVGRNLAIEYRWAGNDLARLPRLAEELVRLRVDAIVTATTAGTRAAMTATSTIPIVFAAAADPVAAGFVASLGRPGGNVTGVSLQTTDVAGKRVQILHEAVGGASIGLLAEQFTSPTQGTTGILVAETLAAGKQLAVQIVVREIAAADELGDAFRHFRREQVKALIVQAGPLTIQHRATITELAAREGLPGMYEIRNFVDAGGLMSYGPDLRDNYRRAAAYVDRIFKGAKPSELPVEQPTKLTLVVNLQAARAIGLAVPPSLLARADEVLR